MANNIVHLETCPPDCTCRPEWWEQADFDTHADQALTLANQE